MAHRTTTLRVLAAAAATFALIGDAHAQRLECPPGGCAQDPVPQPFPQGPVSPPDLAVQFSTCLPAPAPQYVADLLRPRLAAAIRRLDVNRDDPAPAPDARTTCTNGRTVVGAWFAPVGSYGPNDTATARNVGLGRVNALALGESVAFTVSTAGLARLVAIRWRDQPRVLGTDGAPDPDGDVHLTGWTLFLENRDELGRTVVETAIRGWYDGIQDTNFLATISDYLTVDRFGGFDCETYAEADPTETTIDSILDDVLFQGGAASIGDLADAGLGCQIVQALPRSELVPGTDLKAVFLYSRVTAYSATGLSFGGTWELRPRTPHVEIGGRSLILVEPGDPAMGRFSLRAIDMRGPITVAWSTDGTIVSGQGTNVLDVSWVLPGFRVGDRAFRTIDVSVRDADGVQRTASKRVTIEGVLDTGWNALCEAKPWLEQCQ